MARPKGRNDLSVEIRGGLKRAIKAMEDSGKPLSTVWREMFDTDPFNAMRLAIQCQPKEVDVTTTTLSPEDWLELMSDSKPEGTEPEAAVPGPVH